MKHKETTDLAFKQLDMISKSLHDTAKKFKTIYAPINLVKKTVNLGKIKISLSKESEQVKEFFIMFNTLLDSIVIQAQKDANELGTGHVSLDLFDSYIDIIKGSFKEGITEEKTKSKKS